MPPARYTAAHFTFEAWGVSSSLLMNAQALESILLRAVKLAGLRPIGAPSSAVILDDGKAWGAGASSLQLLIDSHASLHGLAQRGHVYCDIFSCASLDSELLAANLSWWLGATDFSWRIRDRTIGRSWWRRLLRWP